MGQTRRLLLNLLPKLCLSRATRVLAHLPIPRGLRPSVFGAFARRYGATLDEVEKDLRDYPTMAAFFQRSLRPGSRPVADVPLVWPADGRIVSAGPLRDGRIPQIKGVDYSVEDLLVDAELAHAVHHGSQATVYLAPGDYHRVHAPFDGEVLAARHVPGGLFPVNRAAVESIPGLFVRNERHVLDCRLQDGRRAAVVMVAALNVSDTVISCAVPGAITRGTEIGRFGLGSTVVAVVAPDEPAFAPVPPETVVRVGGPATGDRP